ncbi:MAG: DNA polymerase III subunit beta [Bacillota bacterium]
MIIYGRQDKLHRCLSVVEKGLPTKTTLPILNGILVDAGEDYLRWVSSNLELSIQAQDHDANIVERGRVVLPGKIVDIVRQLNDDEIKISMYEDELRAEITSGKAVFVLYGMDAAEFPHFTDAEEWMTWDSLEFSATDFKEMFKKIIFAVSHDEGRPLFRAVHLSFESNGKLIAVATDTYRLARVQRFYGGEAKFKKINFLVPGRTLNEILKVLEENPDEQVKCYFKENEIIFCYRQFIFSSRLIEDKFPEVSGVFPATFKTRVEVNKNKLDKLLKRAILMAHGQNQMIMMQIKGNILYVRASSDSGKMDEEMILDHKEGDDLEEILLNARFFSDPLQIIDDEILVIDFNGPLGPCIFYREQEINGIKELYQYLVLPIKTDKRT